MLEWLWYKVIIMPIAWFKTENYEKDRRGKAIPKILDEYKGFRCCLSPDQDLWPGLMNLMWVDPQTGEELCQGQTRFHTFRETVDHIVLDKNSTMWDHKHEAYVWVDRLQHWQPLKPIEELPTFGIGDTKLLMKFPDGKKIMQLLSAEALDYETQYLNHCVGNGQYDARVLSGKVKICSLRTSADIPIATLEIRDKTVFQIKGYKNKEIDQDSRTHIEKFVVAAGLRVKADHENLGLTSIDW